MANFFKELEKSAAIMTIYDSKFAVVSDLFVTVDIYV